MYCTSCAFHCSAPVGFPASTIAVVIAAWFAFTAGLAVLLDVKFGSVPEKEAFKVHCSGDVIEHGAVRCSVSNNKEAFKVDCSDVISIEAADMSVRGGKKQRRTSKEIYLGGQGK